MYVKFKAMQDSHRDVTSIAFLSMLFGFYMSAMTGQLNLGWYRFLLVGFTLFYSVQSIAIELQHKYRSNKSAVNWCTYWHHRGSDLKSPLLVFFWPGRIVFRVFAAIWSFIMTPVARRVAKLIDKDEYEVRRNTKSYRQDILLLAVVISVFLPLFLWAIAMFVIILIKHPLELIATLIALLAICTTAFIFGRWIAKISKTRKAYAEKRTPNKPWTPSGDGVTKTYKKSPSALSNFIEFIELCFDWMVSRKWKVCPLVELPVKETR